MAVGAALSVLAGCANQPKSLYNWSDYQPQVYAYLKNDGEGVDAQILKLVQNMALARSKGETLPPGYHAHLGMLYAKTGRADEVKPQFDFEKTLYPESKTFIDFLAGTFSKNQGGTR